MSEFRSGNGTDWLDFLATHIGRYRDVQTDQLFNPAELQAWLREHDLAPKAPATELDLGDARELRDALHAITKSAVRRESPLPAAVQTVERALASDEPLRVQRSASGLRVVRPRTAKEALARLARSAVQDLSGPARERLRPCGDEICSGIFLDHTGRRHWCSDERCGNRARVRAHRERARKDERSS